MAPFSTFFEGSAALKSTKAVIVGTGMAPTKNNQSRPKHESQKNKKEGSHMHHS